MGDSFQGLWSSVGGVRTSAASDDSALCKLSVAKGSALGNACSPSVLGSSFGRREGPSDCTPIDLF